MQDLFLKPKSKKAQLLEFIHYKKWCKTSEVIAFASKNFSNRGDRDARLLAKKGLIKRMDEERKRFYFPLIKEDVWEAL